MSVAFNLNYTYDGILATDVIIKPVVQRDDFLKLFRVKTGINSKWQIHLTTAMTNIVRKYSGCGDRTPSGSATITNRTLTVNEMEFFISQCKDDFENQFTEEWLKSGVDKNDLGGTEADRLITELIKTALAADLSRLFYFGNADSANANLNGMTGLWTRLLAGVQDSYCVKRVDNIATLNQTAGTRAVDYLENLFVNAPIILKQIQNNQKAFYVTGNIWENYLKTLESSDQNANGVKLMVDGQVKLYYRGIEIIPFYNWDYDISTYSLGNASRILYTTPDNHWIGVEEARNQGEVVGWYERLKRTYYFEGQFKMGYQYAHCDLQAVSYGAAS